MQKRAETARPGAEGKMYQVLECREPALWDAAVLTLPQPHILQSWAWGETKLQTGWRAKRLLWFEGLASSQSASADLPCQTANSFADLAAAARPVPAHSFADLAAPRTAPQSASADLPCQTANSFADLALPYQTANSFADLALPYQTAHSFADLALPYQTANSFADLAAPRTSPQSASADLPCQTANSFADLALPYQTANSFADLALPYQTANPFADLAAPATPVAAAAILIRRLHPRVPVAVAYVPKGPLLDWSDAALAEAVLARLEAEARRAGALFVKIDPDVRSDTPDGQAVIALLARRGWRPSAEQIQFRNTVVSDLTASEDALLAAMKPKWRYNIRLAERKAVAVRAGETTDLQTFYAMYAETGARDGFLVRPFEYYRAIWTRFLAEGLAHVLLAEVAGEPIAGLILFRYGPTAWYFYGASTAQGRDLMPNHALQWAAMRWAKGAGCTRYDWWGAPDVLDESDPMWGVYRFKQGFGGEFVPHIGAWDYPTNRFAYWGYTTAMPRVLDFMRRQRSA